VSELTSRASADSIFDRHPVIDVDTHITEPPDVWTARVASRWGDRIPHVVRIGAKDVWMIGGRPVGAPGAYTAAGFDGSFPDFPDTYEDLPAAAYDARARLALMDENGVFAQVIYPNVGGFGSAGFLALGEPELMLDCVRAYNDFLIDWTREDPRRLLPAAAMPFWDVDAMVAEVERVAALGHRAILACGQPDAFGQPVLAHRHWDRLWAAACDVGLPISFHVGGDISEVVNDAGEIGTKSNFGRASSIIILDNYRCVTELIFGGVCHRFPEVSFVSVESGAGWLPFALEAFDWQWRNGRVRSEHPEYDLLPSEYFERQIYGSFWFERESVRAALRRLPDNLMWETDYPHPTSMSVTPGTPAQAPREYVDAQLADLPDETLRKVFFETAARLYQVEAPDA
jgi:predicted TIM-barrel fold metal-dependent hydrolase